VIHLRNVVAVPPCPPPNIITQFCCVNPQIQTASKSVTLCGALAAVAAAKAYFTAQLEGQKPEVQSVTFADFLGSESVPGLVFNQGYTMFTLHFQSALTREYRLLVHLHPHAYSLYHCPA
jgi:hypothetical protein